MGAVNKIDPPKYGMCFVGSMVLNMLLLLYMFVIGREWKPSWSMRAAMEAEAVASESCSGHGRAYLDGLLVHGIPVCECNTCFSGPDCSQFSPDCPADVNSGNPLFLEPFWLQNADRSALLVSGWHRMSYSFKDGSSISKELKKHIQKLHSIVGNAVTEGRFIVFGAGSTQLLNAAVHSLSLSNLSSPAGIVVTTPYYPAYKSQTDFFRSVDYNFVGDTSVWRNSTDGNMNIIEFVTSPNNPDGLLKEAVVKGPHAKSINDHAYFWPHFTAIPAPADEDLMLFTLSKLTGHAGSRFGCDPQYSLACLFSIVILSVGLTLIHKGLRFLIKSHPTVDEIWWAVIKDKAVYEKMSTYISQNSFGVSHDTQLVALKLLKVVVGGEGNEIFDFGYETMRNRWAVLSKTLSVSNRFSIQEIEPQFCSYYQKIRGPSPAYAWFKCERDEDEDCYTVLRAAGIISREGTMFGADSRYVRLSLIKTQDDFDLLISKLNTLVSEEVVDGPKIM